MNIIVRDPTDKALALAKNLARLKSDPRYRERVVTEVSDRIAAKKDAERSLRPDEIASMRFIPFHTVSEKLTRLNKDITISVMPQHGKAAIGTKAPVKKEVRAWESAILSPWEREEVQRLGHHQGPRPFISTASLGWISPYTDLISEGAIPQIVCRSLTSILRPLVEADLFSWEAAEREFGFRLRGPGTERKVERIPATPRVWAEEKPVTVIT